MELVADTNVLYTYFWKKSLARKVLMSRDLNLFSPEFSLEEIKNYRNDIIKKTGITAKEFDNLRTDLAIAVEFVPVEDYKDLFGRALRISPDPDDADFFALSLKKKIPIWSNDARLKKQKSVPVLSTKDLLDDFFDILFPDDAD